MEILWRHIRGAWIIPGYKAYLPSGVVEVKRYRNRFHSWLKDNTTYFYAKVSLHQNRHSAASRFFPRHSSVLVPRKAKRLTFFRGEVCLLEKAHPRPTLREVVSQLLSPCLSQPTAIPLSAAQAGPRFRSTSLYSKSRKKLPAHRVSSVTR